MQTRYSSIRPSSQIIPFLRTFTLTAIYHFESYIKLQRANNWNKVEGRKKERREKEVSILPSPRM